MPCCSQFNICEVFSIAPTCYILFHSILEPEEVYFILFFFQNSNVDMGKTRLPFYQIADYMFPETQHPSVISCTLIASDINLDR